MNRQAYNPPGVVKAPISIRLMPAELAEVESLAAAHGITRSKLMREAHLKGLPIIKQMLSSSVAVPSSPETAADFPGAGATTTPAGLSTTAA